MLGEVRGPKFEPIPSTRRGEAQTDLTSKPQDVTAVRMPPVRRLISRVFLSLWTLHSRMRAASSTVRFNQLSRARLAREHPDASSSLIFPVLRVVAQAALHRHVRPCACHVWYAEIAHIVRIVGLARRTGIAPRFLDSSSCRNA